MFLRPHQRNKDGKDHTYWSLVETVRTVDGPRQRTLCYLGELNGSAQARWRKSVEVFNEQGEAQQLKLFPSHIEVPDDDPQVARVLVNRVRLERTRQFGACFLGWELWKRLGLDGFFEQALDEEAAEVPWSRVAAVLAINRLCAPGSELAIEERWYPSTALDDLLEIEAGKINDTRLYRCLDRILPHKRKLEPHLKQRYGELFGAEFDVLLYDLTSTYVEGAAEKNPMMGRGYSRDHRPDCEHKKRIMTLGSQEFLRRFLLHVLPRGFVRIRSFGFLANRRRATLLPLCQRLLADQPVPYTPAALTSSPTQPTCFRCPKCSTPMLIVERFSGIAAWQLSTRSAYLDSS